MNIKPHEHRPFAVTPLSAAATAPANWGKDQWRAPAVPTGHLVIFDEPGRVLNRDGRPGQGVCYRAFYFRVTEAEHFPHWTLRVKHGGGTEEFGLGYNRQIIEGLAGLDSDTRYLILHAIMSAHHEASAKAAKETATRYSKAFIEGRLRKQKLRGRNEVQVTIKPEVRTVEA